MAGLAIMVKGELRCLAIITKVELQCLAVTTMGELPSDGYAHG